MALTQLKQINFADNSVLNQHLTTEAKSGVLQSKLAFNHSIVLGVNSGVNSLVDVNSFMGGKSSTLVATTKGVYTSSKFAGTYVNLPIKDPIKKEWITDDQNNKVYGRLTNNAFSAWDGTALTGVTIGFITGDVAFNAKTITVSG